MTAYQPGTCVAEHRTDPDRPRRAVDGAYLCKGHLERLRSLVAALPGDYDELVRSMRASGVAGERVSGSSSASLPYLPGVGDGAEDLRGRLLGWCRIVAEDRGLTVPSAHEPTAHDPACPYVRRPTKREVRDAAERGEPVPVPAWDEAWQSCPRCGWSAAPESDVALLARWLLPHVDWLAATDFATDVLSELEDMHRAALTLSDPSHPRRIQITTCGIPGCPTGPHRCPEPGCGGVLTAYVSVEDDREGRAPLAVTCDGEAAHTFTAERYLVLGRRIHAASRASEREAS